MRVLIAGATGVIGRRLVPLLSASGHEVIALSRTPGRGTDPNVETIAADALDRQDLIEVVGKARPEAVVHLLTAIPDRINPRRMEHDFTVTNRLRTEGTRNLIDAAQAAGATRIIVQGLAYAYDPGRPGPANEDEPLWQDPPRQWVTTRDALVELERMTAEAGGLVLRFGHLYGPGTAYAGDGDFVRQIGGHKLPIIGDGGASFSFTHTHDAATAVVSALTRPVVGALNIVDDEPATVAEWLPELARILGAKPPSRVPVFAARLLTGAFGVAFFTRLRGADNARARLALNWRPRFTSWRDGFKTELERA
ncbi:MAG: NAD-dependent epimerase/dehydratase family protein [Stackebrandtia sp.]